MRFLLSLFCLIGININLYASDLPDERSEAFSFLTAKVETEKEQFEFLNHVIEIKNKHSSQINHVPELFPLVDRMKNGIQSFLTTEEQKKDIDFFYVHQAKKALDNGNFSLNHLMAFHCQCAIVMDGVPEDRTELELFRGQNKNTNWREKPVESLIFKSREDFWQIPTFRGDGKIHWDIEPMNLGHLNNIHWTPFTPLRKDRETSLLIHSKKTKKMYDVITHDIAHGSNSSDSHLPYNEKGFYLYEDWDKRGLMKKKNPFYRTHKFLYDLARKLEKKGDILSAKRVDYFLFIDWHELSNKTYGEEHVISQGLERNFLGFKSFEEEIEIKLNHLKESFLFQNPDAKDDPYSYITPVNAALRDLKTQFGAAKYMKKLGYNINLEGIDVVNGDFSKEFVRRLEATKECHTANKKLTSDVMSLVRTELKEQKN